MGKEKNEPSLHALADIGNVGENGTTVTFTQTLGRGNLVGLGAGGQKVGVVALDEGEEAGDEERVGDGLSSVVRPDTGAGLEVALRDFLGLLLTGLLSNTGLSELGVEVGGVGLLRLAAALLFLLQRGGIEFAIGSGSFLVIAGVGSLRLLGGLLLF